jgi:aminomethyltransferase
LSAAVSDPQLLVTPLHAEHVALGARMVPFAGWEMPVQYAGVKQEHVAVRSAAGLFDVSHMGELTLDGPGAAAFVDSLITNDASKLVDGQALYTCACNEAGTILDDLIVYRYGAERWLVVGNASNRDKMADHFRTHAARHDGVIFADISDDLALIALQGPKAFAVLAASPAAPSPAAVSQLGSFRLCETQLFGVACTVARTGYTGEDGVEIFCAAADAVTLWRALMQAGAEFGIAPAGLAARDTLRLEARLSLYGNDIDETTNPLEAGLGWAVKLNKSADFIGKAALAAIKAAGLTRKLVGFEMTGRGIARQGYPLLDGDGNTVGHCTSGSPSPTLGSNIGMGYLPSHMTAVGQAFVVDCRGRHIEAVVAKTPFYKRPAA